MDLQKQWAMDLFPLRFSVDSAACFLLTESRSPELSRIQLTSCIDPFQLTDADLQLQDLLFSRWNGIFNPFCGFKPFQDVSSKIAFCYLGWSHGWLGGSSRMVCDTLGPGVLAARGPRGAWKWPDSAGGRWCGGRGGRGGWGLWAQHLHSERNLVMEQRFLFAPSMAAWS